MEEDRRELRDYYVESSPARRRQILNVAMETQSDPEADEIRLQIWKLRYAKARENGKSGRADGYLKLWMDLRYLAENPPGRFSVKKTQKRLERELEELGFFQFYDQSEQSRMLLFQECLHTARLYVKLCFSDRNYTSMILGMMPMKEGRVQDKVSKDLKKLYEDLPKVVEIPKPLDVYKRQAVTIGVLGRAYLYPTILGTEGAVSNENVFIEMITKIFTVDYALPFIGGIFLCGILAAIMSTADSQLLVTASSVAEDIYHNFIKKDAENSTIMKISRATVVVVAVLAFLIAWNPDSSIMGLVSNAWAGLGSAFGPIVLLSLFWRRTNLAGGIAGIVSGGVTVLVWDYLPLVHGETLGVATGVYSLAVGFLISVLMIVVFSLATKAPDQEILDEFDRVKAMKNQK